MKLFVVIFVSALSLCIASKCVCKRNEIFDKCGSSCGDLTCETPSFAAVSCVAGCNPGCFCKAGYVRGPGNKCIKEDTCKDLCPSNEHFSICNAGCEPFCENIFPFCTEECKEGCVCDEGFVRNDGKCIPIDNCPCPLNEHFSSCGSACETTCENRNDTNRFCILLCVTKCVCDEGFVRDEDGNCILISSCPICRRDEEWKDCGTSCPDTCSEPFNSQGICNKKCNSGCFCKASLVRNKAGKCVPLEKCQNSDCQENEEFLRNVTICESTCDQSEKNLCKAELQSGCFCMKDFVRSGDKCIERINCPEECETNEIFIECGPACGDLTCGNLDDNRVCFNKKCERGCFCQENYARNSKDECIPKEECLLD